MALSLLDMRSFPVYDEELELTNLMTIFLLHENESPNIAIASNRDNRTYHLKLRIQGSDNNLLLDGYFFVLIHYLKTVHVIFYQTNKIRLTYHIDR
jgi:hypothetical protein